MYAEHKNEPRKSGDELAQNWEWHVESYSVEKLIWTSKKLQ